MGFFASLNFDFSNQEIGSDGGNGNPSRLGTTASVEDALGVRCGDDLLEGGEWCSDEVDTANQFVGSAILPYPVDGHWLHSKCIGCHPPCKGEAARDVFKDEAVITVVIPNLFKQLFTKSFSRDRPLC
mgnify:CR=1 FL=1